MLKLVSTIFGLVLGLSAQAQVPPALNMSGALYTSSGTAVISTNVSFKIEIWDKNLTCVLYSEQHLGLDLSFNKGAFSFPIGSGSSQANNLEGGTGFDAKLFQNYGATGTFNGCVGGVTSAANDNRLIRVYYDTAGGTNFSQMSPDVAVTSAPYAMIAETLQGKTPANFILTNVNSFLGQASVENIFSNTNYPVLTSLLAGNSNLYMSSSPSGPVSFHNQLLTNIANPTAAQDAATKNYVDGSVGGQTFDPTGVGLGVGNGKTIIWDAGLNKWVTANVGGVSSVGTGTGLIGGPITSSGTISVDVGTAANKIVQLNSTAQLPAVDGSLLTNINSSRLGGQPVSAAVPTAGQVLTYNNSQWTAVTNNAITALSGDVVATGPGAVTSTIQANAITSAKINNSGNAVNRLLITNASDGSTVTYATCTLVGEVMQWTALGWACADPATFLGTTGVVADTYGNGTQVPQVTVDATGRVQSLTNVNIAFPVVSVAGHTGVVTLNATDIGGLGTAALQNVGVVASDVLQLNGSAQIPAVDGSLLTNINATKLGTRSVSSAAPSPGQVLTWNNSNSDWEPSSVASSGGTVTSVQAGVGMTGGPVTASGSLNVDVGVTANKIVQLNGSAQLPAVDGSLLTNVNTTKLGTRSVSSSAPSPGQVLAWNSTNGDWEPTAATAGSVTSVQAGVGMTGGPITSTGSLNVDVGVVANKIVQLNGSAQLPAVDGSLLTNVNVSSLIGKPLSSTGPSAGQVLTYNNTTGKWDAESSQAVLPSLASADIWVGNGLGSASAVAPAGDVTMDNGGNFSVKALQGKAVSGAPPGAGQVLTYNSTTSQWEAQITQASVSGWVNGGNTFGANSSIGNTDSYSLSFLTNNSARMLIDSSGKVGVGTTLPNGMLDVTGSLSQAPSTTTGAFLSLSPATLNDSVTPAFSTATAAVFNSIGAPTLTASAASVFTTDAINFYVGGAPKAGTNAQITSSSALYVASNALSGSVNRGYALNVNAPTGAFSNYAAIFNGGFVGIGTSVPKAVLDVYGTGTLASAMIVPRDTTANRPAATSVNGMLRYNTSLAALESYINGSWQSLATTGGSNNFSTDATFTGAGTGLAVTNTATVGGNLTVSGASVLNGGATIAGGALNMSSQNITNVGAGVIGAGALSIAAGGTNQNLTLSGSGSGSVLLNPNVGIGTSTPGAALDINSGTITSNKKALSIEQTWNSAGTTFDAPIFENITNAASGGGSLLIDLQVGGSTQFNINEAGNGQIGGTLQTGGTIYSYGGYDARSGDTTPYTGSSATAAYPGALYVPHFYADNQNSSDTEFSGLILHSNNTAGKSQFAYVGTTAITGGGYVPAIVLGQSVGTGSYQERMRIDQNGNVGIGTMSPATTLFVSSPNAADAVRVQNTNGSGASDVNFLDYLGVQQTEYGYSNPGNAFQGGNSYLWSKTGTNFLIVNDTSTLLTVNTSSGNVGIGTTTPSSALQVAGTITATNFSGNGSGLTGLTDTQLPTAALYRVCTIIIGAANGPVLVNSDIAPQPRQCFIPANATVVEIEVSSDAGTPNPSVTVARNHAGTVTDLTSAPLSTAAGGGIACANAAGGFGIDGATTCSSTLSVTSLLGGDYLQTDTATANGVAHEMSIFITYKMN